ncbi:MAG: transcription antitermination factor NusB [Clostridia bacterium]|nr:transcription antitermination factor NusB [Clostridia bacterium]
MNRSEQREAVFKMIFSQDYLEGEALKDVYERLLQEQEIEETEYIRSAFFGVIENKSELDSMVERFAKGWKLPRLSKVSLCIMRLSIYEMKSMSDVPFAVSINEAVEMAKKYDDDKAPKFVNGILNNAASGLGLK